MALQAGDIVASVIGAVKPIIAKDGAVIDTFAKKQLQMMADQAVMIAEGIEAGEFEGPRKKLLDHHLKMLETVGRNFVAVLAGLTAITIEKAWNAVVDVVWGAIDKAVGIALPRP